MPYFDVNIFGTSHGQVDSDLFTFNLHILQVESDISPTNFDMFISFYAFPFNFERGTQLKAVYLTPTAQELINRFDVSKPQVIHITAATPDNPIALYDCDPGNYRTSSCTTRQLAQLPFSLISPCPNPEDIRLFSGTFCVPYDVSGLDDSWTDMVNSTTGNKSLTPAVGPNFILPIDITIIADGCAYRNKRATANIYTNYSTSYSVTDPIHPYGNVDCSSNPNFYPIGFRDKVRVN